MRTAKRITSAAAGTLFIPATKSTLTGACSRPESARDWSIEYTRADGTAVEVLSSAPGDWLLDTSSDPARLSAPPGFVPPTLSDRLHAPVKVDFVAGLDNVPAAADVIRFAVRLLVADLYLLYPSTEPLQSTEMRVTALLDAHRLRVH